MIGKDFYVKLESCDLNRQTIPEFSNSVNRNFRKIEREIKGFQKIKEQIIGTLSLFHRNVLNIGKTLENDWQQTSEFRAYKRSSDHKFQKLSQRIDRLEKNCK